MRMNVFLCFVLFCIHYYYSFCLPPRLEFGVSWSTSLRERVRARLSGITTTPSTEELKNRRKWKSWKVSSHVTGRDIATCHLFQSQLLLINWNTLLCVRGKNLIPSALILAFSSKAECCPVQTNGANISANEAIQRK